MPKPKPSSTKPAIPTPPATPARKLYDTIAQEMASDAAGITISKMMGMDCLKVRGKLFAGFWREGRVFKLGGDTHSNALALKGSVLFDPSDMKRPMKEWVVVPYAHRAKWCALTQSALDFVASKL